MTLSDPVSRPRVPPAVLVLAAVASVQLGGALAATLLPLVGVLGSVTLRIVLAATILAVLVRPRLRGRTRADWLLVSAFAVTLTAMNLAFYASLARLPIGVAVTVEFLGPLTLAAVTSRRGRDLAAVAAALCGVVLISQVLTTPWGQVDLLGLLLAATAGACWAGYILLSRGTGTRFGGLDGIAICLLIGAVLILPWGVWAAGSALLDPTVLSRGLGIALLSSAIPYSLELLALRHLAAGVFGVLLSLEPAAAALAGLLVLDQTLGLVQLIGMALVVMASVLVLGRPGAAAADDMPPAG